MDASQAQAILWAYYSQTSTTGSFKRRKTEDKEGLIPETWTTRASARERLSRHDVAYLAAYLEIVSRSGRPFYLGGLPLEDEYVWYDRSVMATLLKNGCLEISGENFKATAKGLEIAQGVPRPENI